MVVDVHVHLVMADHYVVPGYHVVNVRLMLLEHLVITVHSAVGVGHSVANDTQATGHFAADYFVPGHSALPVHFAVIVHCSVVFGYLGEADHFVERSHSGVMKGDETGIPGEGEGHQF